MKRIKVLLCVLLTFVLALSTVDVVFAEDLVEDGGEVVEEVWIEIRTPDDLYNINKNMSGNYILMNDIDLTEVTGIDGKYDFGGYGWKPIGSTNTYDVAKRFTGVLDGNGYTIKGLTVRRQTTNISDAKYIGLFASNYGIIKNLTVDASINFCFSTVDLTGAGIISGYNSGTIENCRTRGSIDIKSNLGNKSENSRIGGIVGENSGIVSKCCNNADVLLHSYSYYTGAGALNNYPKGYLGGIVGFLGNNGYINNCFNSGNISGDSSYSGSYGSILFYIGGIAGYLNGSTISNVYNRGEVYTYKGHSCYIGGIAGYGINDATVINSYSAGILNSESIDYDKHKYSIIGRGISNNCYYLSGQGDSQTGATVLTANNMQYEHYFDGFDFDNIWFIDPNDDYKYPQLIECPVNKPTVSSINIDSKPDKLTYEYGEELDVSGMAISVTYSNRSTESIPVSKVNIDKKLKGGQTSVEVNYGNQSTDITGLTVNKRVLEFDWPEKNTFECNKEVHSLVATPNNILEKDKVYVATYNNNDQREAGTYEVSVATLEGEDKDNYTLEGSTTNSKQLVIKSCEEHTPDEEVIENIVPADYINSGSYDIVIYCKVCGTELSRETKEEDPLVCVHPIEMQNEVVDKEPSCKEAGKKHIECEQCETIIEENIAIDKLEHEPGEAVKENEILATYTKKGSFDEVSYCKVCKTEISRDTKKTEKLECNHPAEELTDVVDKAATCKATGKKHILCKQCETVVSENVVIEISNHVPGETVRENEVPATDTEKGSYDAVTYCKVCNIELSREEKIEEKLACTHPFAKLGYVVDKEASCLETGKKHIVCSQCGDTIVDNIVIGVLDHIMANAVKEKEIPATYNKTGSYDSVVYCKTCGTELSRTTKTIEKLVCKHPSSELKEVVDKEATCKEAGKKHKVCKQCGITVDKDIIIEKLDHKPGKEVRENEVAPTYNANGSYERVVYCTVCNTELQRTKYAIDKLVSKVPDVDVSYHTHVQSYGDTLGVSKNGAVSGTFGEAKRLENIWIKVSNNSNLGIRYTTHCQSYGWLPWSSNGEVSGTSGEAKRLEAIKIELTGTDADKYNVYYRVHAQSYGWLGWAKNGEPAGTAGYAKRLECIQIVVLKKEQKAPGIDYAGVKASTLVHDNRAYIDKSKDDIVIPGNDNLPNVMYKTHVQSLGWQNWMLNGQVSGTSGMGKRLEGINIKLTNCKYAGGIQYKTHIQSIGWEQVWKKDGQMSGTSGMGKRLEAIKIELYGEMAKKYNVYYRVHAQSYGWLGWAKNGESAGTSGLGKRLEGIQIIIIPKGQGAPKLNYMGIISVMTKAYVSK